MEVLKKGVPWWNEKEVCCDHCQSKIVINQDDRPVYIQEKMLWRDFVYYNAAFFCPVCDQEIVVKAKLKKQDIQKEV